MQHNIRAVCVGARSGGALHASPPRLTPAAPSRRPDGASDWSTLFKMASSPHKIRFISIPGKETVAGSPDDSRKISSRRHDREPVHSATSGAVQSPRRTTAIDLRTIGGAPDVTLGITAGL